MNFEIVLETLIRRFKAQNIDFAIIGAIAVGVAGYPRFTDDLDFMILSTDTDKINKIMTDLDYKPHQITDEFALYTSDIELFGRVDFLLAHREYSIKMLSRAKEKPIFNGALSVKVVDPEDVIGLKLQSIVNNPERAEKDILDIENILAVNKNKLNMSRITEYFVLFNKENELNRLLKKISYAD